MSKKNVKKLELKKETLAQMTVKSTVKAGMPKWTIRAPFVGGCIG